MIRHLCLLVLSFPSLAQATIYGTDERILVDANLPREITDHGRSVATLLVKNEFIETQHEVRIKVESLRNYFHLCADEAFVDLPSVGYCSGFLIAPDKIATAGHCLDKQSSCPNMAWAFDFKQGHYSWENSEVGIKKENIYSCKKILAHKNNDQLDYMVVQLDRPVENRESLPLAPHSKILEKGAPVFAIGFPLGLPMIWSAVGAVRGHKGLKSTGHLDVNGNSSGSPVFDALSNEVVGILVEGEKDLSYQRKGKCYLNKRCTEDGCLGETWVSVDVLRKHLL